MSKHTPEIARACRAFYQARGHRDDHWTSETRTFPTEGEALAWLKGRSCRWADRDTFLGFIARGKAAPKLRAWSCDRAPVPDRRLDERSRFRLPLAPPR